MTDSGIPVCGAALTPDGSVIFEACGDGNLRAFGTNKGQMIRVMSGHAAFVQTIAMSATGDRLFSAGSDRTHRIWDFAAIDDVRRLGPIQQQARETLQSDPQNAAALKTFGDWYVLHGQWAWALEMFVQARAHGAAIPDLTLARCYWQTGDLKAAEQAFTAAINAKEAPEHYLQLCLAAVKNEKAMQKEK